MAGVDHHGRPEPSEGFLHLFARTKGEVQEQDVEQLCRKVEEEHNVDICALRFSRLYGDTNRVIAHEPHFAWDEGERQVVRRNWSQG